MILGKKGSGAPAGTLHLCLKTTDLMTNAELEVNAANEDIQQKPKMEEESTPIAALADAVSQISTEGEFYNSVGVLLSKLDVLVGFIDDLSKVCSIYGYEFMKH